MAKIHTIKCAGCSGSAQQSAPDCALDESEIEIKPAPHDHGVNTEYFYQGELVRRDCNVDLDLARKVS